MAETLRASQNLASCYENALTVILRLTTMDRQAVPDSQAFRANIRAALKSAMEQAKVLGYSSESNQLAFFAVVALLDESVLRLQIDRIRGTLAFLPPLALAAEAPRKEKRDAVGRWLGIAAVVCLGIAIFAFVLFAVLLGSGASQLG